MKKIATPALLNAARTAFSKAGNADAGRVMQAYMKSEMPYHGVKVPAARKIVRELYADISFANSAAWQREVRALWTNAKFREERYAALWLLQHRSAKAFRNVSALPLFEELIVAGAWWDFVDDIAVHVVAPLLDADVKSEANAAAKTMRAWSRSDDLWKRRTSIICQVLRKERTDLALLEACIAPSITRKEFFLRKAIGWALRSYAWQDAAWVKRYVKAHEAELSGLSKREALKNS